MITKNVDRVLDNYGYMIVEKMQNKLLTGRAPYGSKVASGQLINNLDFKWKYTNGLYEFSLVGPPQLGYVDRGRRPYGRGVISKNKKGIFTINNRFPNISAIQKWIKEKRLPLREGYTLKSQAYVIARGIAIKGIKPFPMIKDATNSIKKNKKFTNDIAKAIGQDLVLNLNVMIKSLK